jgi:hypothetical protein
LALCFCFRLPALEEDRLPELEEERPPDEERLPELLLALLELVVFFCVEAIGYPFCPGRLGRGYIDFRGRAAPYFTRKLAASAAMPAAQQ